MAKKRKNPVKETKEIRNMRLVIEAQRNFRERVADKKVTAKQTRRQWKQRREEVNNET